MAAHNFHDSNGVFPPSFVYTSYQEVPGDKFRDGSSFCLITPYVEELARWYVVQQHQSHDGNGDLVLDDFYGLTYDTPGPKIISSPGDWTFPSSGVWQNPTSSSVYAVGSYAANATALGAFVRNGQSGGGPVPKGGTPGAITRNDPLTAGACTDGLSNTIFFSEKYAICNTATGDGWNGWPYATQSSSSVKRMPIFAYHASVTGANGPTAGKFQVNPTNSGPNATCNGYLAHAPRAAGIIVAMGDGSVRFVSAGISPATWWAALTPRGGEVLGADW